MRFRPDGTPWGFARKLPERFVPADPAGLALDRESARASPRRARSDDWGVDFGATAICSMRPSRRASTGRVDHSFVYEHTTGNIAESSFRLRLTVTGNALTEVTHYRPRAGIVRAALPRD